MRICALLSCLLSKRALVVSPSKCVSKTLLLGPYVPSEVDFFMALPTIVSIFNKRTQLIDCLALPCPTNSGFVSVRNELAGSWLGVALAYFIMTHAHERDLLRILNLVTSDVIQRESSNGHIQSIELKLLGWTKNLYFNPGIYL